MRTNIILFFLLCLQKGYFVYGLLQPKLQLDEASQIFPLESPLRPFIETTPTPAKNIQPDAFFSSHQGSENFILQANRSVTTGPPFRKNTWTQSNSGSETNTSRRGVHQVHSSSLDDVITWDKVTNLLKFVTRSVVDAKKIIGATNSSKACKRGLDRYFESLSKWEKWAVQMADSSGKISGGILEGAFLSLGSFEECVRIRVPSTPGGEDEFRGKHCLVNYTTPLLKDVILRNGSLNGRYPEIYGQPPEWIEDFILKSYSYLKFIVLIQGMCIPSTCSDVDLEHILASITAPLGLKVQVKGCQIDEQLSWTPSLIAAVSVLGVMAIFCTLGTIVDIVQRCFCVSKIDEKTVESKTSVVAWLKAFSVYLNAELLLNRKTAGNSFACLDGIRFFATTWIVLIHNCANFSPILWLKFRNFMKIGDQFNGYVPLAVIDYGGAPLGTFFFISGFLLAYSLKKKLSKNNKKFEFLSYFMHKYWRLTPSLGLTIAVFMVVSHLGSGPLWSATMEPLAESCKERWWLNFLLVSNWWGFDDQCLTHTWYVSCLMQLHVVGFILFHITIRWPVFGSLVGVALFFGSSAAVAILVIWKEVHFPAHLSQRDPDFADRLYDWVWFRPFFYIQTYVIGMIAGHFIMKYKEKNISWVYQVVAWLLSAVCGLYAVYGIYTANSGGSMMIFFYVFHLFAWSICIAWIIYACIAGYGGIVNRFLSWKGFSLLSTLSYLVYLFHWTPLHYKFASLEAPFTFGYFELICDFLSNLVISYFMAFVGYVTVEKSFSNLERFIF